MAYRNAEQGQDVREPALNPKAPEASLTTKGPKAGARPPSEDSEERERMPMCENTRA
jgi:hypothetical protein